MGSNQSTERYNNQFDTNNHSVSPMANDISCKNVNMNYLYNGMPIFACPNATSIGGECSCGESCLKLGESCCQAIEQIKVGDKIIQEHCVEDVMNPSDFKLRRYQNNRYTNPPPEYKVLKPPVSYETNSPVITAQPFVSRPTIRTPRTYIASSPNSIKYQPCNMADVKYGNITIPGQQLCDWFNPTSSTTALKHNNTQVPLSQACAWYNRPKITI